MNTTLGIPLESFNLDEREFERSKAWSSIIKRYSMIHDDSEVDFDNLETEFKDEKVEDDEIDDPAAVSLDEDDDENENNSLNHSVIQLRSLGSRMIYAQPRNRNNGKCSGIGYMDPLDEANENDDFDMQDMLNQTLPILAERERKWQESGMINILNTFDEEKIERKVGSWLRINNSIQAAHTKHSIQVQSPDDDDSLHSMDTARYVLSNRKPRSSNCCSTIKSYRLLQSKRDALREKYAFSEDEMERALGKHVNGARRRNNLKARNDCVAGYKLQRAVESGFGMAKKRRKLFNKQRVRTCSSNRCCVSSSSSDENFEEKDEQQYCKPFLKCEGRRLPAACATSSRTMGRKSALLPRSRTVYATAPRSLRSKCDQLQQLKPRKRASECCCFKEEKLCKLTEHLADTSTEEWVVENCDSLEKVHQTDQNNSCETNAVETTKIITKKKNTKVTTKNKKIAKKNDTNKKPKENTDISLLDSTFERDLQKAIKLSKQTFEVETVFNNDQCAEPMNQKIKSTKSKTKTSQSEIKAKCNKINTNDHKIKSKSLNNVKIAENNASENQIVQSKNSTKLVGNKTIQLTQSEQHKKLLKKRQSMETQAQPMQIEKSPENQTEKQRESQEEPLSTKKNKSLKQPSRVDLSQLSQLVNMSPSIIDDISPARLGLRPQPKSAKLKKIKKLTDKNHNPAVIKNETFLSQAETICNSTAMANDAIALKKQFSTEGILSSATTATETTIITTKSTDELDCTIVSSTTEDTQQRNLTNATYTTSRNANGDILLYTPHNRNLAPSHSCSDGIFNITQEHLSAVIGEKDARKFMKYYVGRRHFDANLTVYYRPPRRLAYNNSRDDDDDDDETDSDVDMLEQIRLLGDLYTRSDN